MMDHDDVRFSSFTRDLARRHRRPRSYPPPPAKQDVLEQLCGGGNIVIPPSPTSLATLATLAGISPWSSHELDTESESDDELDLDELDLDERDVS